MKGIMFSFVMVFFTITLITLILVQRSLVSEQREQLYLETRINSMNNLHESIVRDMKKALDIITIRAISVAYSYTAVEGHQITDADQILEELIRYGTLSGQPEALMINTTFGNWTDKMAAIGDLNGFYINITPVYLIVKPYDSWNLDVETELLINITDLQKVASLNRSEKINSLINLEGLEDPLYSLRTGTLGAGLGASNTIVRTPFEGDFTHIIATGDGANGWTYGEVIQYSWGIMNIPAFCASVPDKSNKILVTDRAYLIQPINCNLNGFMGIVSDYGAMQDGVTKPYVNNSGAFTKIPTGMKILINGSIGNGKVWYIENFIKHVQNSYYNSSLTGPSYLDRLENKTYIQPKYSSQTTNTIGLESFVNKYYFLNISIPLSNSDKDRTNIDYLYFDQSIPVNNYAVKGLNPLSPVYFKIDDAHNHLVGYNVSEIIY